MDKMQNFVVGDIVTAPSPATTGTSVTVDSGSYFPDPSTFGEYNIVLWDKEQGQPNLSNCEIVRVTAKTTDDDNAILTITRAQESTTAKEVTTGWRAYSSPTKKYFDDLKTYIDNLQITKATGSDINTGTDDSKFVTSKAIADSWIAKLYPVGSIYLNATNSTNPSTLLGFGTWSAFGAGRVPVGHNSGDSDFDTGEKTGGSKTANLQHQHKTPFGYDSGNFYSESDNPTYGSDIKTSSRSEFPRGGRSTAAGRYMNTDIAGSTSQTIVQPYITVYMWKRTA